jgi:histidinol-phosphate/aromatic aminotransferase/cobyric acid decarboxylase-like protein
LVELVTSFVPPPGPHGGDGAAIAFALGIDADDVLDLSQSLNPAAHDPLPIVRKHLRAITRYPDPSRAHLALATSMGVDPDRIVLTNGGAEAIALVATRLGGSVVEPEFSLHPRGCGPRWRSNPHSPTGLLAAEDDVAAVWDEAFFPLATGRWTRGDDDAIVVGSLTKTLACPGLRIGYVLGAPQFIESCRAIQPAWSVGGLAAAALPDLLARLDLAHDFVAVQELRERLRTMLVRYGLEPRPSDANWLLVHRPGLREALAPEGIIVRDCTSFGLPGTVRIGVPNDAGLERLGRALNKLDDTGERSVEVRAPTSSADRPKQRRR